MGKQLSIDELLAEEAKLVARQAEIEKALADSRAVTMPYQAQIELHKNLKENIGTLAEQLKKVPSLKSENAAEHSKQLTDLIGLMAKMVESMTGKVLKKREGSTTAKPRKENDPDKARPLRAINAFLKIKADKAFTADEIIQDLNVHKYATAKGISATKMKEYLENYGKDKSIKVVNGKYQFKGE